MNLKSKRLFLFDLDGTIYLDGVLMPQSLELLKWITQTGGHYIFMTNNSSRSTKAYVQKLLALGIPVTEENVVTSTQAAIDYLQTTYPKEKFFVAATSSMLEELSLHGIDYTTSYDTKVKGVLIGYDNELVYQKLYDASKLLTEKKVFLATNPDLVCPVEFGYVPDCGSFCHMLEVATKQTPLYLGKPAPAMVELSMKRTGYTKEQTLVIGDRLYTDIACGVNAKVDTILVLSGESTLEDIKKSPVHPTAVLQDVAELYRLLTQ